MMITTFERILLDVFHLLDDYVIDSASWDRGTSAAGARTSRRRGTGGYMVARATANVAAAAASRPIRVPPVTTRAGRVRRRSRSS
jgi:hypothetical protein